MQAPYSIRPLNISLQAFQPTGKLRSQFCMLHSYPHPFPYSELTDFREFLFHLVLSKNKIIVAEINIYVDIDNKCLSTDFNSLLNSIGFSQQSKLISPLHRGEQPFYSFLLMTGRLSCWCNSLTAVLGTVAPLKRGSRTEEVSSWCNSEIHCLKRISWKLVRKWLYSNSDKFCLVGKKV